MLYYVPRHHWFSVSFYVAAGVNIFVIRTLLLEDYLTKIFRITLKTYKTHQLPYVAKVTQNQYIQYHSYRMPIHFYNPKMPYTNLIIWLCPIVSKLHNVKEVKHKTTATLFTCYNFYFTWTWRLVQAGYIWAKNKSKTNIYNSLQVEITYAFYL